MLISKITIKNFRGIDVLENLEVFRINTFVGKNDRYFTVHMDGTPVFRERYYDMFPYRDGLAWVCRENREWAQIDHRGNVKTKWFTAKEIGM